ncbi:MAG TPA: hypothetical protein VIY48_04040 [Candidatus Paceibacterota bacterium]
MAFSRQEIFEAADGIFPMLAQLPEGYSHNTGTIAIALAEKLKYDKTQIAYDVLRKIAEMGYPGAAKGEPRAVKRYGKSYMQAPWLWRKVSEQEAADWKQAVEAKPRAAGPYAAIDEQIEQIKKRLEKLEALAYSG